MERKPQYKIGTQFVKQYTKRKDVETVEDIHITKNSKGEVVKIRYVASHIFLGQKVYDYDLPASTIAIALSRDHNNSFDKVQK